METHRNPHPTRRDFAREVLGLASERRPVSGAVAALARRLVQAGLHQADALHLAAAVEAEVDYFCTTDDALLKNASQMDTGRVSVVYPFDVAVLLEDR